MTAERRYRAFISYSHSDRKWAMWLLRSLETWRVPSRLVGQTTARGEIPARLSPLFADREELSATDNLRASLISALGHSDALIVICSPAAAQSPWVEQEILRYRELHPTGLILALIVAGDPAGTSASDQCFPRALLCQQNPDGSWTAPVYEPVAADARPQADGRYRAKLKLIAGLLAVDLDNLVAREQQRQQRKWIAMATASLVGMAVMTTLTVFAYRARNEAEHRHVQAEGLIEFMLTDLRQKLEPVGRLDALQVVGEKAMTYYIDEAPDNMQADALGRRQRVMHLLGEIQELRGNLDEAFTLFEQAAKVTDELLQRAPADPQRIFDHAQSEFWVGYLAWRQQNLPEAEQRFLSYLSLAQKLVAIDPKNSAWQTELASAHGNVGIAQLSKQQYSEAIESFSTLKALNQTALAANPSSETRLMLAQSLAWLADAQEANWQFLAAMASRQEELGLYKEGLKTDPENALLLRSLHVCLRKIAALAVARGELANADALLTESIEIIETLVKLEAGNTLWQELKARAFIERGSTLALLNQPNQNPQPLLLKAIAILDELQTTNSSVAAWKESQLRAEYWLTRAHGSDRENAALRILKSKIDGIADGKASEEITEIKLAIYNQLARSSVIAEEPPALWQQVLATLPKNKKLSPTLQLQACLALLGLNDNALFTACAELDRSGYQHPDFAPVTKYLRAQKV